jgi:hypothetical protein
LQPASRSRTRAFDAISGSVRSRAQGKIFRKHISQDRGKKHRHADPEPRRVMDAPPVAPWGVRLGVVMGAISRHVNPFPPCRRRSRVDESSVTASTIAQIRNRDLLGECNIDAFSVQGEPRSRPITETSGVSRFRRFIGARPRGIERASKADVSQRQGPVC